MTAPSDVDRDDYERAPYYRARRRRERAALARAEERIRRNGRLPRAGAAVELDCGHRARLPRDMGRGAERAFAIAYWAHRPCRDCALARIVETADEEIAVGNESLNGRGLAAMGPKSMRGHRARCLEEAKAAPAPLDVDRARPDTPPPRDCDVCRAPATAAFPDAGMRPGAPLFALCRACIVAGCAFMRGRPARATDFRPLLVAARAAFKAVA